jgi:hypothetical protein
MTGKILIHSMFLLTHQFAKALRAHMPALEATLKGSASAEQDLATLKVTLNALRHFGYDENITYIKHLMQE